MSETKTSLDLSAFADDYLIVGERDSPDDSRIYVANRKTDDARRRDDSTGVLITVLHAPAGDEANALTQYAADVGTLSGLTHRRLLPVIEGRWVGNDAYGVVTQRVGDQTLAQKLVVGETFHSTRIAAILREVNGLLEWARDQKIVHRRVTPDQVFLEPKTDRVRVMFAIAPIKRVRRPGAHEDARTIARLAVAMLGGDPEIQACDQSSLMDLRPGLPQMFCEATSKLLDPTDETSTDDVAAYIGLIGMADPLVEGETLRDRIRAEILEEQRAEREKLANERAEFEKKNADERTEFERVMAEERATYEKEKADERAAQQKAKEEERARVEKERAELQKQVTKERAELQQALATERAALLAKRAELEKTVADQVAELQRAAAADRAEIERLKMAIRTAGALEVEKKRLAALEDITGEEESVIDNEDLAAPLFGMPMLPPIEPVEFDDETPVLSREPIVFEAPPMPEEVAPEDEMARRDGAGFWSNRRNQLIAAAAAVVIIVGGGSAMVVSARNAPTTPVARTTPRAAAVTPTLAPAQPAGTNAPAATPPAVASTVDSATARGWLDSLRHAHPMDMEWAIDMARVRVAKAERARAAAVRQAAAAGGATRDTMSQPAGVRASSPLSQPAPVRAAPDTVVRRDTVVRPDTTVPPV